MDDEYSAGHSNDCHVCCEHTATRAILRSDKCDTLDVFVKSYLLFFFLDLETFAEVDFDLYDSTVGLLCSSEQAYDLISVLSLCISDCIVISISSSVLCLEAYMTHITIKTTRATFMRKV